MQTEAAQRTYADPEIMDPAGPGASLSGDARAELMCVGTGGKVRAWRNSAGVAPWSADTESAFVATEFGGGNRTKFADLDGDGRTEAIHLRPDGRALAWKNVRGFGTDPMGDSVQVAETAVTTPDKVWFADLDGDRKADLLMLRPDGEVEAWHNCEGFATPPWCGDSMISPPSSRTAARRSGADLDGDRKVEAIAMQDDGNIRAWHNCHGFAARPWCGDSVQVAVGEQKPPRNFKFADLDGDGRSDVAVVQGDRQIRAWWNGIGWGEMPWRRGSQ